MMTGLNNTFLYTAKKLVVRFSNGLENHDVTGTCFFINKNNDLYLITNRHMVDYEYSTGVNGFNIALAIVESFSEVDDQKRPFHSKKIVIMNHENFVFPNELTEDVAILKSPTSINSIPIICPIPFELVADDLWINEKLSVCDSIAYPGFPEFHDVHNNAPIFRMGTISSDPRAMYSGEIGVPQSRKIAFEGFSSSGSSGSPVYACQKGFPIGSGLEAPPNFYREVKLIGINSGHFNTLVNVEDNNYEKINAFSVGHSGISYFFKSTIIIELINKCN